MLLNSVVGQVDKLVLDLADVVRLATHADVALFEAVALVFVRDHYPQTYVKLALIYE